MTSLNSELSQAVREAAGAPLHVTDPATQETYVLLRGDLYERMKAFLVHPVDKDDIDPQDAYAAFWQVAGPAGWDDPEMDVYEQYRKPS